MRTFIENGVFNVCDTRGDDDSCEVTASVESIILNGRDTLGNRDAREASAVLKNAFADYFNTVRYFETGQA